MSIAEFIYRKLLATPLGEKMRREGREDVLHYAETWEPLINPTVADVETAVKEAARDARRYYSQPAATAPDTARCKRRCVYARLGSPRHG